MFCSECGRQLKENAKFCPNCGTPVKIDEQEVEPDEISTGETTVSPVAVTAPGVGQAIAASHAKQENTDKQSPTTGATKRGLKKKHMIIGGAIVGALVVVAIVGNVVLATLNKTATFVAADDKDLVTSDEQANTTGEEQAKKHSTGDGNRYEEITVGDYKIEQDPSGIDMLTFTVTNNTKDTINAAYDINGTFTAKNGYGDDINYESRMNLFVPNKLLMPGENTVVAYAQKEDNYVAQYYGDENDPINYTLNDASKIDISVDNNGISSDKSMVLLSGDDYKIETTAAATEYGGKGVKVSLTNNTDYRWRKASIYVEAVDDKAGIANPGYVERSFYTITDLEYIKPGETKDTELPEYTFNLDGKDFSQLKILSVWVEKESDTDGSND